MSDLQVIKFSKYIRPVIKEDKTRDWVMNGVNNEFYQYLIDRYNGSPTNATVINSYINLMYGRGLHAKNAVSNVADWTKLKTVLKSKDLRKMISDFVLFNEFSFQVIESKGKELSSITHLPKQKVIPSVANEEEEIEYYWYSRNWKKRTLPENKPEMFFAFNGQKQADCIYVARPYKAGKEYFSDPEYLAGMPYAEAEEEIANLYINAIKKGLSAGLMINVKGGKNWTPEERAKFKKSIKNKLTGSENAGDFIISFNGEDVEISVESFPVNENVHKQWAYLTEEARQQLLTAHGVTSPMLFGIKDSTGLGNNANELDEAEAQLMKRVIKPKQDFVLSAITEVLELYEINLDLEFLPLTEIKEEIVPTENVELSKKKTELELFIENGEDYDSNEGYDLINESEVNYEDEEKISLALASTGTARPNANSSQDTDDIVIRYRYVGNKLPEREFCQKMMLAGKVYRKEDIIAMGSKVVNAGWGANGADTYSIWLYKGGGACKHKWNRVIYLKKGAKIDVNNPLAEIISTSEARRRGYKVETNDNLVSIAPTNMTNKGFLPSNPQ